MGRLNGEMRPGRRRGIDAIHLEQDVLLFDGRNLRWLEGTGAAIWRRIDGRTSAAEMARSLADAFSASPETIETDVLTFLEDLAQQGLLDLFRADGSPRYQRQEGIGYVLDAGRTLLIDLRKGTRQVLTPTGSRVWELTAQHGDPETIIVAVSSEYPDGPSTLAEAVRMLLDQLVDGGYLTRRD